MSRDAWLARVREEEQKIIAAEGMWSVKGRYFAREADAALQRRWEAEVRASRAIALEVLRKEGCAFCGKPFLAGETAIAAALQLIHETPCSSQWNAEVEGRSVEVTLRRIA